MKALYITLIVALFTFAGFKAEAQKNIRIKKSEFKISEDQEFKDAWKNVKKGNRRYRINKKGAYLQALEYYTKAYEYNEDHAGLNLKIGIAYMNTHSKYKALKYIDNAYYINPNLPDVLLYRAMAYQYSHDFKKAIIDYEDYLNALSTQQKQKKKMLIDKKIEECHNGIELQKSPVRCFIDNLGEGVNSSEPEYSPVFFLEDSILYFTSRRENTTGGRLNPADMKYYEDVYMSRAKNGVWGQAEQMGKPINTKHNDAAVDISPEGRELCVYRGYKGYGNLFNSQYKNGKWGHMNKLNRINKRRFKESSVSVTKDSLTLYFVSNRKNKLGGKQDIWYSYRTQDGGHWQRPEPLNKANSKYDEETVEISSDGRTLYFSSKGHNSIGGYDIFKIYRNDDGTWTDPENVGYPINTADDDVFFMLTPQENIGYFAADRPDSYGDKDIYQVVFLGPEKPTFVSEGAADEDIAYFMKPTTESDIEKPVNIVIIQLSLVKGVVTDAFTGNPIKAMLELTDNSTGKIIKSIETYPATGSYTVPLPPGKEYALTCGAPDYFFHSENFVIADTAIHMVIQKDIQLQPMGIGAKIVLNNVFFDTGKSILRPESYPELQRIIDIMKQFPRLKLEISGHTDNQGNDASNMKLSQNRAQAVVDYIVSQGITIDKIVAQGYGESQPRADNKTKEGRQLNRRVEAKILDN